MSITTIIFDYGCVLSLAPTPEDYEPLREAIGADAVSFQEIYWRNRDAYDRDVLDNRAYWQKVALAAGVPFSIDEMEKWAALDCQIWDRPNAVMVEWVRVLRRRGLKLAVLSNISRYVGNYFRRTAQWLELFDHLCFSGELGIVKPNPAIYRVCLEALGVPASQALFIDDREVNIAGAHAAGIHGILFRSVEQLPRDIEPYGLAESLAEAHNG
ncbi:MAG: HAD family phosphatase [Terriglobia bacterium]|jgi:putative hydrolase of the HAD superfamily